MRDLGQALKKSGSLFLFREVMWKKKQDTPSNSKHKDPKHGNVNILSSPAPAKIPAGCNYYMS